MRELLILRHAKSDWKAEYGGVDHERPLNDRGEEDARRMGRFLAGLAPDAVVSSTALRARTTVELAAAEGGWEAPTYQDRGFYEATPASVLDLIRSSAGGWKDASGEEAAVLLVAGHEPTSSGLVTLLTGGGAVRFPTAAVARISFPAERWSTVRPGTGELRWLVTPKLLRSFL